MEAVLMWLLEAIGNALLSNIAGNLKESAEVSGFMDTIVAWFLGLFGA